MLATAALPILIALAAAEDAAAPLAPGERVRFVRFVRRYETETTTATVVEAGPAWMRARPTGGADVVRIPFDGLARLEVARGRRSRAGEGALIGFIPGALLGGWVGYALGCLEGAPTDRGPLSRTEGTCKVTRRVLEVGVVFGSVTALVGTITGAFIKTDCWQRVPTRPVTTQLSVAPVRGGAAVTLRVAWP